MFGFGQIDIGSPLPDGPEANNVAVTDEQSPELLRAPTTPVGVPESNDASHGREPPPAADPDLDAVHCDDVQAPQIELCEAIVPIAAVHVPLYTKNSLAHIKNARNAKKIKKDSTTITKLESEKKAATDALCVVARLLPGASKLIAMPAAAICIGRKKVLVASDLQVAAKALHLPHTSDVSLGISIKRLQFAGCKAIEWRQQDGVDTILRNSKLARKVNDGYRLQRSFVQCMLCMHIYGTKWTRNFVRKYRSWAIANSLRDATL